MKLQRPFKRFLSLAFNGGLALLFDLILHAHGVFLFCSMLPLLTSFMISFFYFPKSELYQQMLFWPFLEPQNERKQT